MAAEPGQALKALRRSLRPPLLPGGKRGRFGLRSPMPAGQYIVLYDDACPMCAFQMKVLRRLDWLHVLSLLPLSHPRAREVAPQLTREALLEAIHCVGPTGQVYRAARCLRFVGMRLPLLVPLALLLWLPGALWVADRIYRWVSRNRMVLSRAFGCNDACAIRPAPSSPPESVAAGPRTLDGDPSRRAELATARAEPRAPR